MCEPFVEEVEEEEYVGCYDPYFDAPDKCSMCGEYRIYCQHCPEYIGDPVEVED